MLIVASFGHGQQILSSEKDQVDPLSEPLDAHYLTTLPAALALASTTRLGDTTQLTRILGSSNSAETNSVSWSHFASSTHKQRQQASKMNHLPLEVNLEISSYLSLNQLADCRLVSHSLKALEEFNGASSSLKEPPATTKLAIGEWNGNFSPPNIIKDKEEQEDSLLQPLTSTPKTSRCSPVQMRKMVGFKLITFEKFKEKRPKVARGVFRCYTKNQCKCTIKMCATCNFGAIHSSLVKSHVLSCHSGRSLIYKIIDYPPCARRTGPFLTEPNPEDPSNVLN